MNLTRVQKAFYLFLILDFILLALAASNLSISHKEAFLFFGQNGLAGYLAHASCSFFGNSNLSLRLPFIIVSIANVLLMYYLSKDYFRYEKDRLYNVVIFALLPGMISASILVNEAVAVIFCTLVYLAWFKKFKTHNYLFLSLFLFVDNSFMILYFGLLIYSVFTKNQKLLYVSGLLFLFSLMFFGFDTGGRPKGYFIETIGIFATIFSPLLFLYYFYSMYSVPVRKEQNILWYIAFSSLILALLLSFRQRVNVEDFAPFAVISIPFMMKLFLSSMRVRLKEFRTKYYLGSILVVGVLIVNSLILVWNKPIYLLISDPSDHFAFYYSFADEIAISLKNKNINNVKVIDDEKLQIRLKFYGIKSGDEYIIKTKLENLNDANIVFSLLGKPIYGINVTKLNIN